ncbi:MAG: hypothetical protein QMD16_03560 [Desulfitobacteriaceae bacterium]|nr:hypothetical protein [Desulfitobacteriaceae bacterium]
MADKENPAWAAIVPVGQSGEGGRFTPSMASATLGHPWPSEAEVALMPPEITFYREW